MFVDLADDLGVPFARLSDATLARIDDALDPGLEAANPLDAWGTGIDADAIFREAFAAMAADPDVAALAFVVDLTVQGEPYGEGYLQISLDTAAVTDKPFCVLSNLHSAIAPDEAAYLRDAGHPDPRGDRVRSARAPAPARRCRVAGPSVADGARGRRRRGPRSLAGSARGAGRSARSTRSRCSPTTGCRSSTRAR